MRRGKKVPAEPVNPVAGLAQRHGLFMLFLVRILLAPSVILHHMVGIHPLTLGVVEDGGVVAAVEIDIRLYEKVIGKQAAALSEHGCEQTVAISMLGDSFATWIHPGS